LTVTLTTTACTLPPCGSGAPTLLLAHAPSHAAARCYSALSEEHVELVRRTFAALERAFDAYWRDPRPIVKAMDAGELWPDWEEWFEYVHPEIVWRAQRQ
jgi:hypothetical protein